MYIYFTEIMYLFHSVFYNSFLQESGTILQTIKIHLPVLVFSLQMLRPRDKNVYISMYAPFIGVRILQESVIILTTWNHRICELVFNQD